VVKRMKKQEAYRCLEERATFFPSGLNPRFVSPMSMAWCERWNPLTWDATTALRKSVGACAKLSRMSLRLLCSLIKAIVLESSWSTESHFGARGKQAACYDERGFREQCWFYTTSSNNPRVGKPAQ